MTPIEFTLEAMVLPAGTRNGRLAYHVVLVPITVRGKVSSGAWRAWMERMGQGEKISVDGKLCTLRFDDALARKDAQAWIDLEQAWKMHFENATEGSLKGYISAPERFEPASLAQLANPVMTPSPSNNQPVVVVSRLMRAAAKSGQTSADPKRDAALMVQTCMVAAKTQVEDASKAKAAGAAAAAAPPETFLQKYGLMQRFPTLLRILGFVREATLMEEHTPAQSHTVWPQLADSALVNPGQKPEGPFNTREGWTLLPIPVLGEFVDGGTVVHCLGSREKAMLGRPTWLGHLRLNAFEVKQVNALADVLAYGDLTKPVPPGERAATAAAPAPADALALVRNDESSRLPPRFIEPVPGETKIENVVDGGARTLEDLLVGFSVDVQQVEPRRGRWTPLNQANVTFVRHDGSDDPRGVMDVPLVRTNLTLRRLPVGVVTHRWTSARWSGEKSPAIRQVGYIIQTMEGWHLRSHGLAALPGKPLANIFAGAAVSRPGNLLSVGVPPGEELISVTQEGLLGTLVPASTKEYGPDVYECTADIGIMDGRTHRVDFRVYATPEVIGANGTGATRCSVTGARGLVVDGSKVVKHRPQRGKILSVTPGSGGQWGLSVAERGPIGSPVPLPVVCTAAAQAAAWLVGRQQAASVEFAQEREVWLDYDANGVVARLVEVGFRCRGALASADGNVLNFVGPEAQPWAARWSDDITMSMIAARGRTWPVEQLFPKRKETKALPVEVEGHFSGGAFVITEFTPHADDVEGRFVSYEHDASTGTRKTIYTFQPRDGAAYTLKYESDKIIGLEEKFEAWPLGIPVRVGVEGGVVVRVWVPSRQVRGEILDGAVATENGSILHRYRVLRPDGKVSTETIVLGFPWTLPAGTRLRLGRSDGTPPGRLVEVNATLRMFYLGEYTDLEAIFYDSDGTAWPLMLPSGKRKETLQELEKQKGFTLLVDLQLRSDTPSGGRFLRFNGAESAELIGALELQAGEYHFRSRDPLPVFRATSGLEFEVVRLKVNGTIASDLPGGMVRLRTTSTVLFASYCEPLRPPVVPIFSGRIVVPDEPVGDLGYRAFGVQNDKGHEIVVVAENAAQRLELLEIVKQGAGTFVADGFNATFGWPKWKVSQGPVSGSMSMAGLAMASGDLCRWDGNSLSIPFDFHPQPRIREPSTVFLSLPKGGGQLFAFGTKWRFRVRGHDSAGYAVPAGTGSFVADGDVFETMPASITRRSPLEPPSVYAPKDFAAAINENANWEQRLFDSKRPRSSVPLPVQPWLLTPAADPGENRESDENRHSEVLFLPPSCAPMDVLRSGTLEGTTSDDAQAVVDALKDRAEASTKCEMVFPVKPFLPTDDTLVLKYLADPHAHGVHVRLRHELSDGTEGISGTTEFVLQYRDDVARFFPDGGDASAWPNARLLRLRVERTGSSYASGRLSAAGNLLTIYLPRGMRLIAEVRTVVHEDHLEHWGAGAPAARKRELVLAHPSDPLEAPQVLQRPVFLRGPATRDVRIEDMRVKIALGSRDANGRIALFYASSRWNDNPDQPLPDLPVAELARRCDPPTRLEAGPGSPGHKLAMADWIELAKAAAVPGELVTRGLAPSLAEWLFAKVRWQPEYREVWTSSSLEDGGVGAFDRENCAEKTKEEYAAEPRIGSVMINAKSRDEEGASRQTWVTVGVGTRYPNMFKGGLPVSPAKSTECEGSLGPLMRPPVAEVAYVIPVQEIEDVAVSRVELKVTTRRRTLRLYLARGFYASGEGELLALLFAAQGARGTRLAADPAWHGFTDANLQALAPENVTSPQRIQREAVDDRGRQAALFEPRFCPSRALWYVDLDFPPLDERSAFVRLVLTRHQGWPKGPVVQRWSDDVEVDFVTIDQDSVVTVKRTGNGNENYELTVGPMAPSKNPALKTKIVATLQFARSTMGETAHDVGDAARLDNPLAWQDYAGLEKSGGGATERVELRPDANGMVKAKFSLTAKLVDLLEGRIPAFRDPLHDYARLTPVLLVCEQLTVNAKPVKKSAADPEPVMPVIDNEKSTLRYVTRVMIPWNRLRS